MSKFLKGGKSSAFYGPPTKTINEGDLCVHEVNERLRFNFRRFFPLASVSAELVFCFSQKTTFRCAGLPRSWGRSYLRTVRREEGRGPVAFSLFTFAELFD